MPKRNRYSRRRSPGSDEVSPAEIAEQLAEEPLTEAASSPTPSASPVAESSPEDHGFNPLDLEER